MALYLFTQKEIERIDINEIPEEFINYFDGLNNTEKQRISELRPDLTAKLGYEEVTMHTVYDFQDDDDEEKKIVSAQKFEEKIPGIESDRIFENIYDGRNLRDLAKTEMNPLQLLTIRKGQEKCKIHRRTFEHLQFSYSIPSTKRQGAMATYKIMTSYCSDCNRLYIESGNADEIQEKLSVVGKKVHIYSLEETDAFIRSQMKDIEITSNEIIYVPDVWIEDNPICPIHNERIEEYLYRIVHKNKTVGFNAYFCEKCNKIMLRRTKALDIEDKCAEVGIPMPKMKPLIPKAKKKQIFERDIKPDFFIENGKRKEFTFYNYNDFYNLDESDTVVVSDSIYCNLLEHDTDEVMVVFSVNQKRDGKKNYLCLAGYCAQCQKYYMSEDDYKLIYPLGRPEVTIISDIEGEDYQITSGEVFDLEKKHLADLEGDLNRKTEEIYKADDYVNPYETIKGGYDDGGLQFGKARSELKYGDALGKWNGYKPKPYTYRVDLSSDSENITYYLGPTDIQIDNDMRVISFNDRGFGAKLANYRTIDIEIGGKKYKVKLSRQFDIDNKQLYGYVNLRTDEDIIFRSGITDPFLIKVLNLRKKQHNLVDIIATIQENQNAIVDEKFHQDIVVQGCAGSGKTMVLLHRLSSLKYNNPDYNFDEALILTPNEQFSLHIKGLAEGLQIGSINRSSIEQYYIQILEEFSANFVPRNALVSEIFVNQSYVDYIYSDDFKVDLDSAYKKVLKERQDAFAMLKDICEETDEDYPNDLGNNDSDFLHVISRVISHISEKIALNERNIAEAEIIYKNSEKKLKDAQERLPRIKQLAETAISDVIPKVYEKLVGYSSEINKSIIDLQTIIRNTSEEMVRVEKQFFLFGKKNKLSDLKNIFDKAETQIKDDQAKMEKIQQLLESKNMESSDEDILNWMSDVMLIIPNVSNEIRYYKRCKNELYELHAYISEIEGEIEKQKNQYESIIATEYSENIKKALNYLKAKVTEYSELDTFKMVFEQAVADFKETNKIKVNKGIHRYDLYAAILFCIKFYDKLPGTAHYICVDEGQDMSLNEYRLIYLLNQRNVVFNVYGDVNQLLKPGRGISDWNELEKEFSMKEFRLNENYRNTNQITRFCNSNFEMDVMQTGVDGAKVREIPRCDLEKELAEIKLGAEKIALLVPRSVRRKNYLEMDILPVDIMNAIGQKIDNGLISFMYVDEVKGIEFDKVFVVSNRMSKNEKYIAYTRALSELVIVVDEKIVEQGAAQE